MQVLDRIEMYFIQTCIVCVHLLLDSTPIFWAIDIEGHQNPDAQSVLNMKTWDHRYAKCLPNFH